MEGSKPTAAQAISAIDMKVGAKDQPTGCLPDEALDDRIAIVGTSGAGKTYTIRGFVERLLEIGARITVIDLLGVWWGLRASADGCAPGYPVVVCGGRHADVPITTDIGAALGRTIAMFCDENLSSLVICRMVNLSLGQGNSDACVSPIYGLQS
jgi:Helicase HerA, central domain